MYWLLGRNSQMLLENKILLYKTVLKPIWTYPTLGHSCKLQLWNTAKMPIEGLGIIINAF